MPTLLDLMGIKNTDTIQFGQDLLATNRRQVVAFRNGDFTSPQYTKVGSTVYNNKGEKVTDKLNKKEKSIIDQDQEYVTSSLDLSDKVITGDLLRFYTPSNFKNVNKQDITYNYTKSMAQLKQAQKDKKSSLLYKNNDKSTVDLYSTDAPELK